MTYSDDAISELDPFPKDYDAENAQASWASARQVGGIHYKTMAVEPWSVVDSWPLQQRVGFYRGNALKYLMRIGTKDAALQEAQKAQHYLEKLIETLGA